MPEITCDYMVPLTVGVNTDTGEVTHVTLHLESFQSSMPGRFIRIEADGSFVGDETTYFRNAYGDGIGEHGYAADGESELGDKALAIGDRVTITGVKRDNSGGSEIELAFTLDPEEQS